MKVKRISKTELLNAKFYYPGEADYGWIELKNEIFAQTQIVPDAQKVEDVAKYLNENIGFGKNNQEVKTIRNYYVDFKRGKIDDPTGKLISVKNIDSFIEACPDILNDCYFLRGGNKRSIAYAMHLIKDSLAYIPIIALWEDYFTRDDWRNSQGLNTSQNKLNDS